MVLKYVFAALMSVLLVSSSCNKLLPEVNATVKDFTGFDGCRILLVLDNGQKLEPVSLPSNTSLINDRRVAIRYREVPRASICMSGPTVEIISLRYL